MKSLRNRGVQQGNRKGIEIRFKSCMDAVTEASRLASEMPLGAALTLIRTRHGEFELVAHWKQGEFHHDVVVRLTDNKTLAGPVIVIATNCNGGIKETLVFDALPDRYALWAWRCPSNEEFSGTIPTLLERAETFHWFDPQELLKQDARSELKPEFRKRQRGGGWEPA